MSGRERRDARRAGGELNRGDYRGDFGGEGYHRFDNPPDDDGRQHHEGRSGRSSRPGPDDRRDPPTQGGAPTAGRWQWERHGREGWQRVRVEGGQGTEARGEGAGMRGAGRGAAEETRGGFADHDWQPTRPARGRGAWAGDWENEAAARHDARDDYRGRGPRAYRRSDAAIEEEVCERLTDDGGVDATDIAVRVSDGEVTLSGRVSTRAQKRRAEECVERVRGVHDVLNQLRVTDGSTEHQSRQPDGGDGAADRGRRS